MTGKHVVSYLGLGSSIGDRLAHLRFAVEQISSLPQTRFVKVSHIYETQPVGGMAKNMFLNAVLGIKTELPPETLLHHLRRIETASGRRRRTRWEDRKLDIDILFYGRHVIKNKCVHIPHPRIPEIRFVLAPLSEIAPRFRHPVIGRSMRTLLASCPDTSGVTIRSEMALTFPDL